MFRVGETFLNYSLSILEQECQYLPSYACPAVVFYGKKVLFCAITGVLMKREDEATHRLTPLELCVQIWRFIGDDI